MKGVVVNYRRGRHTQYKYQVIVYFPGIDSREKAAQLVGKRVVWITPNKYKLFVGVITAPHGNKGRVRVRFRKGVPGQMIGDVVYLVEPEVLNQKMKELVQKLKQCVHIDQARKVFEEVIYGKPL